MSNLIKANFMRLRRDKAFYIFLTLAAVAALALIIMSVFVKDILLTQPDSEEALGAMTAFPYMVFGFEISNGINLLAVIAIAIFVGMEHTSGIVRNKIIAGHARSKVFMASWIVSVVYGVLIISVYLIVMLAVGVPLIGWGTDLAIGIAVRQLFCGVIISIVSATVANFAAMLSRGVVAAILINLAVVYGLTILVGVLGLFSFSESLMPVAEAININFYMGQLTFMFNDYSFNFFLHVLVSAIIAICLVNWIGCKVFRRIDLK